jgi:hypothetical protein
MTTDIKVWGPIIDEIYERNGLRGMDMRDSRVAEALLRLETRADEAEAAIKELRGSLADALGFAWVDMGPKDSIKAAPEIRRAANLAIESKYRGAVMLAELRARSALALAALRAALRFVPGDELGVPNVEDLISQLERDARDLAMLLGEARGQAQQERSARLAAERKLELLAAQVGADGGFTPVDRATIHVVWDERKMNFACLCGNYIFAGDEPVTCKLCGRVYRLTCLLEVQEQPHGE